MPTELFDVGSLFVPRNIATTARIFVSGGMVSLTSTVPVVNALMMMVCCEKTALEAMLCSVSPAGTEMGFSALIKPFSAHTTKKKNIRCGVAGFNALVEPPPQDD